MNDYKITCEIQHTSLSFFSFFYVYFRAVFWGLNIVTQSFACKKGCQRNCGCRKAGLHCSPICTSCEGRCNNVEPPEDSSDIDVEETEERERGKRLPTLTMEQSDPEPGPDAIEEPQYDAEERDFPDDKDDEPDILLPALPEDTPHILYTPPQRTDEEILERSREYYELMAKRRTVRSFSTEPIPDGVLDNIIKTAGTSPSGAHTEPWTFIVVKDPDVKEAIRNIVEEEEELNYAQRMSRQWVTDLKPFRTKHIKPYLTEAPAVILVFRQAYSWRPDGKKKMHYYSEISVAIAAGILLAAIQYCGLVALTSTPLNCNSRLRDLLSRPVNERLELLLPVGRPHPETKVPDILRKPLDEIIVKI